MLDGKFLVAHQTDNANSEAVPWTSSPNLPLRYQIVSTASAAASSMRCICSVVLSEGGKDKGGTNHSHGNGTTHVDANVANTSYPLCGIRLQTGKLGAEIDIESVSAMVETADAFLWKLCYNPTIIGTAPTWSAVDSSACEGAVGTSANTVTDDGHVVAQGYVQRSGTLAIGNLPGVEKLGALIDGTKDELWLTAAPLSANCDVLGAINWRETF
jgi:hypothetical protein